MQAKGEREHDKSDYRRSFAWFFLYLVCAFGIRNGAVGMVHLYDEKVQKRVIELKMTSAEEIKKRGILFKSLCIPGYIAYALFCVCVINGAQSFSEGFWQIFVIFEIMNLIDRLLIDEYWVGHTKAWVIPGTEDLQPYITAKDKIRKWIFGTAGMAVISAVIAGCLWH